MKQRRVRFALLATFVVVCLIAAVPSFASQARIVRLSQIDGDVQIDRGGTGLEKAVLNMPVIEGTRIVAENDATVEVEFENGGTMRIVGPATVNFRELSLRNGGDKTTLVDLQPGIYYFDLKQKGDDDFRIGVSSDTIRVKKTSHFRVDVSNADSKIAVFKGELMLEGADREVAIKSDETVTLDASDAGRYYLAKGTDSLFSDTWDREREQYRDQYAKADTWKYTNNQYGSPYSYGFSDLNYYGNYFNVPGYGWMWRPSMYGANWDPFSNGAWSYYPGQGWMFVSMYPWGWAPYRYGQWMFVPGYGWSWRPGGNYTYWNPIPVVRRPPPSGTWHRPLPPATNAQNTVFVNPAPALPNGPVHTWRRPSATPAGATQGLVNGAGTPVVVAPTAPRPVEIWNRDRVRTDDRPTQDRTNNVQRTVGDVDRNEHRGEWRRVTPPQQPSPQQPTASPAQVTPPQRTVTPPPQRQVEPRHESRPAPAPHMDRAPSGGNWSRPAPTAPASGRHQK